MQNENVSKIRYMLETFSENMNPIGKHIVFLIFDITFAEREPHLQSVCKCDLLLHFY